MWLFPEDSHLGGGAAIPESLEGEMDCREHPCLHFSASLTEKPASIQLCISAPVSWCLPGGPGIMTLRGQPVADEQKQFPYEEIPSKPNKRDSPPFPWRGVPPMWSEGPGSSRTVPLGVLLAILGFSFFGSEVGALRVL